MPFLSDTASAIKSRFGFQDRTVSQSVPSTPDLPKSVSRENLSSTQSLVGTPAVRRITDWDDEEDNSDTAKGLRVALPQRFEFSEDPSFWKDHNVQVRSSKWRKLICNYVYMLLSDFLLKFWIGNYKNPTVK